MVEGLGMTDTVENLILDLVAWVGRRERTYEETMEAWRTSCPRLPVWEDSTELGLVETAAANGGMLVRVTPAGSALLRAKRPKEYEELRREGGEFPAPVPRSDDNFGGSAPAAGRH
jgi:hypothetical protein